MAEPEELIRVEGSNYWCIPGMVKPVRVFVNFEHPYLVVRLICEFLGVKENEVTAKGRKSHLVEARHIICYMLRTRSGLSFRQIGLFCGYSDHTNVLKSVRRTEGLIEVDERYRLHYEGIFNFVYNNIYGKQ